MRIYTYLYTRLICYGEADLVGGWVGALLYIVRATTLQHHHLLDNV